MIFGAKLIKVRWQFTDAEGQEVRLQLPFPGRTSLSFAEVRKVRLQSTCVRDCERVFNLCVCRRRSQNT